MDLSKFCDKSHPFLSEPFSEGPCTYASDGHMLIRVPLQLDVKKNRPADLKLEELAIYHRTNCQTPFPKYKPEPTKECNPCRGTGKAEECPECEGEGFVSLENDFNFYECDCKTCDGEGSIPGQEECENCNGTGQVFIDQWAHVDIGNVRLGKVLLDKIKDLPGVILGPVDVAMAPVTFHFDGGSGILMPMTK